MATKTFEVVVRIEIETPDKTMPNEGDVYDIVAELAGVYKQDSDVYVADIRCDSVVECEPIKIES
jgi:HSP20 family molecular chaperone IbpA